MTENREVIDNKALKLSKYKDKMLSLRSTIHNLRNEFDDSKEKNSNISSQR